MLREHTPTNHEEITTYTDQHIRRQIIYVKARKHEKTSDAAILGVCGRGNYTSLNKEAIEAYAG
jgi:hypothetical protein